MPLMVAIAAAVISDGMIGNSGSMAAVGGIHGSHTLYVHSSGGT